MVSSKNRIIGTLKLEELARLHKDREGHEPYFTLTPAGARALQEHILENAAYNGSGHDGDPYVVGIKPEIIRSFLTQILKIRVQGIPESPEANLGAIASLFDSVSGGCFPTRGTTRIAIEPIALDALAQDKKRGR